MDKEVTLDLEPGPRLLQEFPVRIRRIDEAPRIPKWRIGGKLRVTAVFIQLENASEPSRARSIMTS
jgi:hypothetical protein